MDMCFSVCVVTIPVPWGHISGKSWGDEVSKHKILCIHGEYQERAGINCGGWYGILECTRAGALGNKQMVLGEGWKCGGWYGMRKWYGVADESAHVYSSLESLKLLLCDPLP